MAATNRYGAGVLRQTLVKNALGQKHSPDRNAHPNPHNSSFNITLQPAPVKPTDASKPLAVHCSGHIDRRIERYRDNPAGVFKLTAIQVHFLAMSEIARIWLIWQHWRHAFQCRFSLRTNVPELDSLSLPTYLGLRCPHMVALVAIGLVSGRSPRKLPNEIAGT